jgi:hypothetical protein
MKFAGQVGLGEMPLSDEPASVPLIYHLLKSHQAYDESVFAAAEARHQERRLRHLRREAAALGFTLAPQASVS